MQKKPGQILSKSKPQPTPDANSSGWGESYLRGAVEKAWSDNPVFGDGDAILGLFELAELQRFSLDHLLVMAARKMSPRLRAKLGLLDFHPRNN